MISNVDTLEPIYNQEIEEKLVGCCLVDPAVLKYDEVAVVDPKDFFIQRLGYIFNVCLQMSKNGGHIDLTTISDNLNRIGKLTDVGGDSYLTKLMEVGAATVGARDFARRVKEDSERRNAESWHLKKLKENRKGNKPIYDHWSTAQDEVEYFRASTSLIELYQPVTWADQAAIIPEINWLWDRWIPIGLTTMVVGRSDVGKSALALQLARVVIEGGQWPDGEEYEGGGLVCWCEQEAAEALNFERAAEWGLSMDKVITPTLSGDILSDVDLMTSEGWHAFEQAVKTPGVKLAIIDSLGGAYLDESDARVKKIVKRLALLARDLQIALIIIHHPRKLRIGEFDELTLERVRGHSGIVQFARSIFGVETPNIHNPDGRRIKSLKLNLGKKPKNLGFTFGDRGLIWTDAPEPIKEETQTDKAIDLLRQTLGKEPVLAKDVFEQADHIGVSKETVKRAKKTLSIVSFRKPKDRRWWWSFPVETQIELPEYIHEK
jgi:hypothetical protein